MFAARIATTTYNAPRPSRPSRASRWMPSLDAALRAPLRAAVAVAMGAAYPFRGGVTPPDIPGTLGFPSPVESPVSRRLLLTSEHLAPLATTELEAVVAGDVVPTRTCTDYYSALVYRCLTLDCFTGTTATS